MARYQGRGYLIHQLYFQREHGSDWKRSFRRILKCFGIGAGVGFVVSLYRILALNSLDYASLLVDPLVGALLLYVVYAVGQLGKLLVESVRTMPLIRRSGQTRMEITSVMQLLNHDFSFHEFEAELVNLYSGYYLRRTFQILRSMNRRHGRAVWEISYTVNIQE